MTIKNKSLVMRISMLALVAFLALPLTAFGQSNGRGRGKPTDVFVNGHDARDGRWDKNNRRDNDDWRREQERIRLEELRRQQARTRNRGYGGYGGYGNYGGYSDA